MSTMSIVVLVACLFAAYFAVLFVYMKRKKARQLDEFKSKHSGNPLDEQQKRALAFGGILFSNRFEKILTILPEDDLNTYVAGLKNQWEIENSSDAKEALENLLNLTKSKDIDSFLEGSPEQVKTAQKEISKELGIPLASVEATRSTFGWDTMRAVTLARGCNGAGYLTEQETWEFIHKAAGIASTLGKSWDDYTVSFLLGRTIHGFDLEDIGSMAKYILNGKTRGDENTDIYLKYSYK